MKHLACLLLVAVAAVGLLLFPGCASQSAKQGQAPEITDPAFGSHPVESVEAVPANRIAGPAVDVEKFVEDIAQPVVEAETHARESTQVAPEPAPKSTPAPPPAPATASPLPPPGNKRDENALPGEEEAEEEEAAALARKVEAAITREKVTRQARLARMRKDYEAGIRLKEEGRYQEAIEYLERAKEAGKTLGKTGRADHRNDLAGQLEESLAEVDAVPVPVVPARPAEPAASSGPESIATPMPEKEQDLGRGVDSDTVRNPDPDPAPRPNPLVEDLASTAASTPEPGRGPGSVDGVVPRSGAAPSPETPEPSVATGALEAASSRASGFGPKTPGDGEIEKSPAAEPRDLQRELRTHPGQQATQTQSFGGPIDRNARDKLTLAGELTGAKKSKQSNPPVEFDFGAADEIWVLQRPGNRRGEARPSPRPDLLAIHPETRKRVPLPLEHTSMRAEITGLLARVQVEQRFGNPFRKPIEVDYLFPLPEDAAVTDFVMTLGDRKIRGVIREREEAEAIYDAARKQGYRAALVQQERPNVFRQRIAHLEPGRRIDVALTYFHSVPRRDGRYEFTFPTVVGPRTEATDGAGADSASEVTTRFLAPDQRSRHDLDLQVTLDAGMAIRHIDSPSHAVQIERPDPKRAVTTLGGTEPLPNRDFVLRYTLAGNEPAAGCLHDGKHFVALIEPPTPAPNAARLPCDRVFVVDCSDSMRGEPLQQAKQALRRCLQTLDPADRFTLLRFAGDATAFSEAPVPATPANREAAADWIDELRAGGETDMLAGIGAALATPGRPGSRKIVTFMTDGYIGDEAEVLARVQQGVGDARIFSFGVGQAVNHFLLEGLARLGRGASATLRLDEKPDWVIDRFNERIARPACTDATIDWNGMEVTETWPARLPDLLPGRPILVTGAFRGPAPTHITFAGRVGGKPLRMDIPLTTAANHPGVAHAWARQKLRSMIEYEIRNPAVERRQGITDFSIAHKVLCGYTAFLAVDAAERTPGGPGDTVRQAVPAPEGVDFETTTLP